MAKKVKANWEAIELAYRANVKTVAQIAEDFNVKDSTLRSRAKRNGWSRDLGKRIRLEADNIVNANAVKREVGRLESMDNATVEENAKLTASIRISHREDIGKARALSMMLLEDLKAQIGTDNRKRLEDLFIAALKANAIDESALEAYERVTSVSNHVRTLKDLADIMTKFVALERQAYGLDDADSSPIDALTSLLHSIANNNGNAFSVVKDDPAYEGEVDNVASNTIGVKADVY
ncbi:hypothetical protein [Psychrobacter sp. UBA6291]|uniref:hypothetical protein n=1 Tax=Psychrobacter sp. UBA6291 TaxID=1947357 RepID=UPI00257CCBE5|nr:hypothetical protein [Psychrobacter sp. UBA6291]